MNAMSACEAAASAPRERFERSMVMDFDKWHDGTGYDLRALHEASAEERAEIEAVLRHAPKVLSEDERGAVLAQALAGAGFYGGLTQALDQAAQYHPPAVVEALWRGLSQRPGEVAVHFAALLSYLHGLAEQPFDWAQRPFFLEFHTEDLAARAAMVLELRRRAAGRPLRGNE